MMKLGMTSAKFEISASIINLSINWKFIIGFLSYIASFLLWTFIISKFNLSYIYPVMTAILFVLIMIVSAIFLKETITSSQIIGVVIIIIGVLVTILKK